MCMCVCVYVCVCVCARMRTRMCLYAYTHVSLSVIFFTIQLSFVMFMNYFCLWLFSLLYSLPQYCCALHKNYNKIRRGKAHSKTQRCWGLRHPHTLVTVLRWQTFSDANEPWPTPLHLSSRPGLISIAIVLIIIQVGMCILNDFLALTHLDPDQPLPFRYEVPCKGK